MLIGNSMCIVYSAAFFLKFLTLLNDNAALGIEASTVCSRKPDPQGHEAAKPTARRETPQISILNTNFSILNANSATSSRLFQ